MKYFLQHILKENLNQITADSYFNYGVKGLHMIDFINTPTKGLKLFIAESNNNMQPSLPSFYQNGITYPFQYYSKNASVQCVKGHLTIWEVAESNDQISLLANEFEVSGNAETQEFHTKREHVGLKTAQLFSMQPGQIVNLPGNILYNFGTRFGSISAWMVFEGKDLGTPKLAYTNLDKFDTSDLYQKPTTRDVLNMVDAIGLLK